MNLNSQVVAFIKGTRTAPQCGFSYKVLTMLNEARSDYEVVNVLDEQFNPGVREAIKSYSQWPTIPQVCLSPGILQTQNCMAACAQLVFMTPVLLACSGLSIAASQSFTNFVIMFNSRMSGRLSVGILMSIASTSRTAACVAVFLSALICCFSAALSMPVQHV